MVLDFFQIVIFCSTWDVLVRRSRNQW